MSKSSINYFLKYKILASVKKPDVILASPLVEKTEVIVPSKEVPFVFPSDTLFSEKFSSRPQQVSFILALHELLQLIPISNTSKNNIIDAFIKTTNINEDGFAYLNNLLEAVQLVKDPVSRQIRGNLLPRIFEIASAMKSGPSVELIQGSLDCISSFNRVIKLNADSFDANFNEKSGLGLDGMLARYATQCVWYYIEQSLLDLEYTPAERIVVSKLSDLLMDMLISDISLDKEFMADYLNKKLDHSAVALHLSGNHHFTMVSMRRADPKATGFESYKRLLFLSRGHYKLPLPEDPLSLLDWMNTGLGMLHARGSRQQTELARLGLLSSESQETLLTILQANDEAMGFNEYSDTSDKYDAITKNIRDSHLLCHRGSSIVFDKQIMGSCTQSALKFFIKYFCLNLDQFGVSSPEIVPLRLFDKVTTYLSEAAAKNSSLK
jgi:hypothetical protein